VFAIDPPQCHSVICYPEREKTDVILSGVDRA
jgi:hypothetical protein